MAGPEEPVESEIGTVEDRLDGGDDGDVIAEHRKIGDAVPFGLENGQRGRRHRGLEAESEEHHLAGRIGAGERERVHGRVDHAHVCAVGLGLQQAFLRAGHAHGVAEGREDHMLLLGNGDAIVDPPHRQDADRASRPVHQFDLLRQHALDAVAKDRVGVAAADFHDVEGPLGRNFHRSDQRLDFVHESAGLGAIAEFVEVFHAASPLVVAGPPIVGQQGVHEIPEDVIGGDMTFLDAMDRRRRHDEAMIQNAARSSSCRRRRRQRPMVASPISLALTKAAMRLAELPLVEMPTARRPPWLGRSLGGANTCSKPTSLPTAEIMAMSAARLIAASAGRPAVIGCTNSTAICEASQLEPPLPMENSRPPRR